jgi:hypothetical protein
MRKLLMGAALLAASCTPAYAQQQVQCYPLDQLEATVSRLQTKYGEKLVAAYQSKKGARVAILANLKTGTSSVLAILPDRVCPVDVGDGFKFTHAAGEMPKEGQDS